MSFSKEEYKQRLLKVQSLMRDKKIDLIISHDTNNMNYLTGYDAWSFYYAQCAIVYVNACLLYTSPSPRDPKTSRMPSSA